MSNDLLKKQTDNDHFNPEVAEIVCEIYSRLFNITSKVNVAGQRTSLDVISMLSNSHSFIRRIFAHIRAKYGGV